MGLKIKAHADYFFWTKGKIYDVIDIEINGDEKIYTILDDNGEITQLSDIKNVDDFILMKSKSL